MQKRSEEVGPEKGGVMEEDEGDFIPLKTQE